MMRLPVLFFFLFLGTAALVQAASFSGEALFARLAADLAAETAAARAAGKPFALLLEMSDCPACAALRKNVLSHPQAVRGFGERFHTARLLIDPPTPVLSPKGERIASDALATAYGVPGTPAFLFFDGEGRLLYRHLGPVPDAASLVLLGRFVSEGHFETEPLAAFRQRVGGRQATALVPDAHRH